MLRNVVACTFGILACHATPARGPDGSSDGEPSARWDGSVSAAVNGRDFVFAGPVLHLAAGDGVPADSAIPSDAISARTLALAHGVPDLEPNAHEYDATASLFTETWSPEQALERDRCAEAYGHDWRLPTSAEARAVLSPFRKDWGQRTVLTRDAGTPPKILMREVERCHPYDRACARVVRLKSAPLGPTSIYCVAPLARRPPSDAARAELGYAIGVVERLVATVGPRPIDLVDPGALDLVLAARAACSEHGPNGNELLRRVRAELGTTGIAMRGGELRFDAESLKQRTQAIHQALGALAPPVIVDCQSAQVQYETECWKGALSPRCLTLQATFATACMSTDAITPLEAIVKQLEGEARVTERRLQREHVIGRAVARAVECTRRPSEQARFAALYGEPFEKPYPCRCEITDLACALRGLRDPFQCARPVPGPPPPPPDPPPEWQ